MQLSCGPPLLSWLLRYIVSVPQYLTHASCPGGVAKLLICTPGCS